MFSDNLGQIAGELGLEPIGSGYAGFIDGWPVYLSGAGQMISLAVKTSDERNRMVLSRLKELIRPWNVGQTWARHDLRLLFNQRTKGGLSVGEMVRQCLRLLRDLGVAPYDVCPVCGLGGCDVAALHGSVFRLAHGECLTDQAATAKGRAERNERTGSYALGFVGALIGMLVGTVPSLVVIIATETIYSLLMALIPICAYYGYKLFRGRMNKAALAISALMTVLGVLVIQWELVFYYTMNTYHLSVGKVAAFVWQQMKDPAVWGAILKESASDYVMAGIGFLASLGVVGRTGRDEARDARVLAETARPIKY